MPGIQFAFGSHGGVPQQGHGLLANSLSGTGTPPASYLRGGDLVVQSTAAAITAGGVPVIRQLLAADKTAHYLQGTPIAGIRGVACFDVSSNNLGQVQGATPGPGVVTGSGIFLNFPSMAGGMPVDSNTGRARMLYFTASELNVFRAKLAPTSAAATPVLSGTLAGLILTTANGVTTYTIDTGAAAADQCLRILSCDASDPLYGAVGGAVFFQFLPTFDQEQTAVNYSSQ